LNVKLLVFHVTSRL